MAKTTEEILALAEKVGVKVTVSTGPLRTTGEVVLLPGVRPPASS